MRGFGREMGEELLRSKSEGSSATTKSAGARLVTQARFPLVLLRHRTAPGPRPLLPGAMAAATPRHAGCRWQHLGDGFTSAS